MIHWKLVYLDRAARQPGVHTSPSRMTCLSAVLNVAGSTSGSLAIAAEPTQTRSPASDPYAMFATRSKPVAA